MNYYIFKISWLKDVFIYSIYIIFTYFYYIMAWIEWLGTVRESGNTTRVDYLIEKWKKYVRDSKNNSYEKDYSDWKHDILEAKDDQLLLKYKMALELMMTIECIVNNKSLIESRLNVDSTLPPEIKDMEYQNFLAELFLAENEKFIKKHEKAYCEKYWVGSFHNAFKEIVRCVIAFYKDSKALEPFKRALIYSFVNSFDTAELIEQWAIYVRRPQKLKIKTTEECDVLDWENDKEYDMWNWKDDKEYDMWDWEDNILFLKKIKSWTLFQYQDALDIMKKLVKYNSASSSASHVENVTKDSLLESLSNESWLINENSTYNQMNNFANDIKIKYTEKYMAEYWNEWKEKFNELIEIVAAYYWDKDTAEMFKEAINPDEKVLFQKLLDWKELSNEELVCLRPYLLKKWISCVRPEGTWLVEFDIKCWEIVISELIDGGDFVWLREHCRALEIMELLNENQLNLNENPIKKYENENFSRIVDLVVAYYKDMKVAEAFRNTTSKA